MVPTSLPVEVMFLGSLPFNRLEDAKVWIKKFPLTNEFRIQLPQCGHGYDMISEVFSLMEGEGEFAGSSRSFRKDQLVGPATYLQIEGGSKEKREFYRKLLSKRIGFLGQVDRQERVFCLDEPMLTQEALDYEKELSEVCAKIRSSGQKLMIHCCQTQISEGIQDLLCLLRPEILSIPFNETNIRLIESQLESGFHVCLGLSPEKLSSKHIVDDLRNVLRRSTSRQWISTECGLGLLSEELASKFSFRLYELAEVLRGFSRTL